MAISVAAMKRSQFNWGKFVSAAATTGGLSFTTAMNQWNDGQLEIVGIHGASASNLGSGYNVKCARFRHVVNCTTAAHETYGAVSQLVVRSTSCTHLHAGIMGTFEGHTTGVTCASSYSVGHACVMGRLGGHAAITATTPVAGFLAFNNASADLAATGVTVGFATSMASSSYPWILGLYLPVGSVRQAIRIGNFASSGATTGGIAFNTTLDTSSGAGWGDGQLDIISAHGASASNLGSGYNAKVGRFRHIVNCTTCAHETYGAVGQCVVKSTTLQHLHAGLMGTFEVQTACTVPSGVGTGAYVSACGVLARVGGATITIGATGLCAGVIAMSNNPTLSVTSGGVYAAFAAVCNTTGFNTMLYCQDCATLAIFSAASDTYAHGVKAVAATPAGNTSHAIKVLVGTTAAYIPAYDNENF